MDLKELKEKLQNYVGWSYIQVEDIERTGKATRLNEDINKLMACRDHLEDFASCKFDIAVSNMEKTLNDANLDAVKLDNFKPEDAKCIYSQEVLKAVRKELKETILTIDYEMSELRCSKSKLEDMYERVNDSCIDD